ncbi:MAG: ribonuclease III [Rickettsiales bacterium]|jgi:ribonuclease-3|nr:ribonuclease III [Rickettsiales bacterium]
MFKEIKNSFADKELLKLALTHSSRVKANVNSNERIEFLGDRVLGLVIAEELYKKYAKESEGDLAKRHAFLVSAKNLTAIAKKIGLEKEVIYSKQEVSSLDNLLADCMEAVFGAVFLDGGFEKAKKLVLKLFKKVMDETVEVPVDMKSKLQEVLQKRGYDLPEYSVIKKTGTDHNPEFTVEVQTGLGTSTGIGATKKEAEQKAAFALLTKLKIIS